MLLHVLRSAAQFGPLRRWVGMQAGCNPALAAARQAAVDAGELPPQGAHRADA